MYLADVKPSTYVNRRQQPCYLGQNGSEFPGIFRNGMTYSTYILSWVGRTQRTLFSTTTNQTKTTTTTTTMTRHRKSRSRNRSSRPLSSSCGGRERKMMKGMNILQKMKDDRHHRQRRRQHQEEERPTTAQLLSFHQSNTNSSRKRATSSTLASHVRTRSRWTAMRMLMLMMTTTMQVGFFNSLSGGGGVLVKGVSASTVASVAAAAAAEAADTAGSSQSGTESSESSSSSCENIDVVGVDEKQQPSSGTTKTDGKLSQRPSPPNKFCEQQWYKNQNNKNFNNSTTRYLYDVVAASSDGMWSEGRGEDVALVRAMRKIGRKATRVSMQDYDFDWSTQAKAVVIRSAWDKYNWIDDYWQFQRDVDEHSLLFNPIEVLQWSANKDQYLKDLHSKGIHMVETAYVTFDDVEKKQEELPDIEPTTYLGADVPDLEIFWELFEDVRKKKLGGCEDVIMKPATGNGAVGVRRWPNDDEDVYEEFGTGDGDFFTQFRVLSAVEGDVLMFQCFQKQILTKGERGIIFVGGEVTHGLLKMPKAKRGEYDYNHYVVNTDFGGTWSIYQPTPDEVDFAKQVAAAVADCLDGIWPAYLRVDIFYDNDDKLALMELAAGTANIWLEQVPEAADALARYIDSQLTKAETECAAYYEQQQPSS